MRIHLHLTPNRRPVPFNYQSKLVGAFHRWLGENELHDDVSLYSLSWLGGGRVYGDALDFPRGASFFISAPDPDLLSALIQGVFKGHEINWGMEVSEVTIQRTPDFGKKKRFVVQSPVLIKRNVPDRKQQQYYFPGDPEADRLLTETLQTKLKKAGLEFEGTMRFDPDYKKPKIKKIQYRQLGIKAAFCPVIVEGDKEAVQFAWETGAGNSTGIAFGALK